MGSVARCEVCGGMFQPYRGWAKYCSGGCRLEAWRGRWRDKRPVKPAISTASGQVGIIVRRAGIRKEKSPNPQK